MPCGSTLGHVQVTPQVLAERYEITPSTPSDALASMAVAEFQGQHFKPKDIKKFAQSCHVNVTVDKIVGGNKPPSPGVEAELDIEYIKGVAPGVPLTVVYVKGSYSLLKWAEQITSMEDSPLVHSVSYGNDEKQQTGALTRPHPCALLPLGSTRIDSLPSSASLACCCRVGSRRGRCIDAVAHRMRGVSVLRQHGLHEGRHSRPLDPLRLWRPGRLRP